MRIRPRRKIGGRPAPPCGLAFDGAADEAVLAERGGDGGIRVSRVPRHEPLSALITSASVRTTLTGWSAHTDRTPLPVTSADDDETILTRLIEAQAQNEGTINLRFTYSRTLDERLVLTQALRTEADEAAAAVTSWLSAQRVAAKTPPHVETDTATRNVARLWLSGPVSRGEIMEDATVAVLVVGDDGYGMGLWGKRAGFVYETGEKFKAGATEVQLAAHIHAKLSNFVTPATVGKLGLSPVRHLVVASSARVRRELSEFLNTSEALREIRIERLLMSDADGGDERVELDLAEALAVGAIVDAEVVPALDLSAELTERLTEVRRSKDADDRTRAARARRAAAFAALAPLSLALAFVAGGWWLRRAEASALDEKISAEKATAAKLKRADDDYASVKANFSVISNLITQITTLRDKQADAYRLLVELNSRWPQGTPWYVSEVNSTANQVEVKGRARDEQAVTMFVRALENSEGLFSGVTESHSDPNAGAGGVTIPALPQVTAQRTGPAVVQFVVRATYTPRKSDSGVNENAPRVAPLRSAAQVGGR
jgi:Tfp pilus assembly protein PilN